MIHFVLGFRTDLMGFRPGMAGDSPCMGFRTDLMGFRSSMAGDSPCMGFRTDLMRFYPSMAGDSLCMGFRTDFFGFRPGAGDPLPQRWLDVFRLFRRTLRQKGRWGIITNTTDRFEKTHFF